MRKLFQNFSWIVVGNGLATLLRAATLLWLVRRAEPTDFALYAGFYGVLVFGKAISDLGMTKLITRDRSVNPSSEIHGHALKINTLSSISLAVLGSVVCLFGGFAGFIALLWLLPLPIAAGLEKNADTWRAVHLADGRAHLVALDIFLRRLVVLACFGLFDSVEALNPILSMSLAEFTGAAFSMLTVRFSLRRRIALPEKLRVRAILDEGRSFWVQSLAMHARNLDVSIVGMFSVAVQSGYFAAATRLSGPLQLIPSALAGVLLPHAAREGNDERGRVGLVIFATTGIFLPFCILLALIVPPMIPHLLGPDYVNASLAIQLIIVSLPLSVYANLTAAALQGQGYARETSQVSSIYAAVLLISIAVGSVLAGANGAAAGTLLTNLLLATLMLSLWIRTQRDGQNKKVVS